MSQTSLYSFWLIYVSVCLSGCLQVDSTSESPTSASEDGEFSSANGSSVKPNSQTTASAEQKEKMPDVHHGGRGISRLLTFDNTVTVCGSKRLRGTTYEVRCRAMVEDKGKQFPPTQVDEKLSLNWRPIEKVLSGSKILDEKCYDENEKTTRVCEITLEEPVATKAQVDLQIAEVSKRGALRNDTRSDVVELIYSVLSIGIVPPMVRSFKNIAKPNTQEANIDAMEGAGYVTNSNNTDINFGRIRSSCAWKGQVLFATDHYVYRYYKDEKGRARVEVFAGTQSTRVFENGQHRLKLSLGRFASAVSDSAALRLYCTPNAVFISDQGKSAIFRIDENDRASLVAGTIPIVANQTIAADGELATSKRLFEVRDLHLSSSGQLYFIDRNAGAGLLRMIDKNGKVWTISGGTRGASGNGGLASKASFHSLAELEWRQSPSGLKVYLLDHHYGTLRVITAASEGSEKERLRNGIIEQVELGHLNGFGSLPIRSIAISPEGEVYILTLKKLYHLNSDFQLIHTVGAAELGSEWSSHLALHPQGGVLISTILPGQLLWYRNKKIEKLVGPTFGVLTQSPLVIDTNRETLGYVNDLALAPNGQLYVTIRDSKHIYRYQEGKLSALSQFVKDGKPVLAAAPVKLRFSARSLYFSDTDHRIYRVSGESEPVLVAEAGELGNSPSGPYQGLANFMLSDFDVDEKGDVYVIEMFVMKTDLLYHTARSAIVRVEPSGRTTLVSGGGTKHIDRRHTFLAPTAFVHNYLSSIRVQGGSIYVTESGRSTRPGVFKIAPQRGVMESWRLEVLLQFQDELVSRWRGFIPLGLDVDSQGRVYFFASASNFEKQEIVVKTADNRLIAIAGKNRSPFCGGGLKRRILSNEAASEAIQANIEAVCFAPVTRLRVHDNCDEEKGTLKLLWASLYDSTYSSIVKVERPCEMQ